MAAEAFETYFRAADLDRDGRVSGQEAVAFFRGSGLPQQVLAQIWNYADRRQSGFLERADFFNALKLVTVAQSGRQLAPEIVQAALHGPAAAKIPAPRINIPASVPQTSGVPNMLPTTRPQMSVPNAMPSTQDVGSASPQTLGFRGQPVYQNSDVTPQAGSPLGSNVVRPPQHSVGAISQDIPSGSNLFRPSQPSPLSSVTPAVRPIQKPPLSGSVAALGHASPASSNLSTDWYTGKGNFVPAAGRPPVPANSASAISSSQSSVPSGGTANLLTASTSLSTTGGLVDVTSLSSQTISKEVKSLVPSGNGSSSISSFGSELLSAVPQQKQSQQLPTNFAPNNAAGSTANVPTMAAQPSQPPQLGPLQNTIPALGSNSLPQQSHMPPQQKQLSAMESASASVKASPEAPHLLSASVVAVSNVSSPHIAANNSQDVAPWPKITQSDIQKYTIVFIKVDKDRDGKITGQEARNLFYSWRVPREILKKVWDLSDQDNDGMLSFREFCTAVYLMERHRERRTLPDVLPSGIWSDGIILPSTGQFSASGGTTQSSTGFAPQAIPGSRHAMPPPSMKQPSRVPLPAIPDESVEPEPPKSKVPVLEKTFMDQLSKEEQNALESKFKEATDAEKKVQELEKEIVESREKIEFYRTKMQELILYKSRVDNRLNEISERVSADRREAQVLAQKYEEKCKKVGDVASKLTIEEATFREIQEKKLEIYNNIVKLQKGEGSDDSLQERANKVQSDLEELMKSLSEQCKQYGLRAKPTTLLELPFGWQAGILEAAAVWDENWDTFGDDGFTIIKELTVETDTHKPAAKENSSAGQSGKISSNETPSAPSSGTHDSEVENHSNGNKEGKPDVNEKSEDHSISEKNTKPAVETKVEVVQNSSHNAEHTTVEIQHDKIQTTKLEKRDASAQASESISEHDASGMLVSGTKRAEEHSRGIAFDHTDDADSLWGFSKAASNGTSTQDYFLGTEGLPPIRTGLTPAASTSGKELKPSFDSAPGTPLYNPMWTETPSAASISGRVPKPLFDSVPGTPVHNPIWSESPSAASLFGKEQRSLFDSSVPSTPLSDFNRTGSPPGLFGKGQRSFFDSSVPSTPIYNSSGFSPKFSEAGDDRSFDSSFNRFDSFSSQGNDAFGQQGSFSRLDSFNSSSGAGADGRFSAFDSFNSPADHGNNSLSRFDSFGSTADRGNSFSRFDSFSSNADHGTSNFSVVDSFNTAADHGSNDPFGRFDSFGSSADIGTTDGFLRFDSNNDQGKTDNFSRFDSFRSTGEHSRGYSFDDGDPFGSGPFKTSGSHSPTHGADKWSSF